MAHWAWRCVAGCARVVIPAVTAGSTGCRTVTINITGASRLSKRSFVARSPYLGGLENREWGGPRPGHAPQPPDQNVQLVLRELSSGREDSFLLIKSREEGNILLFARGLSAQGWNELISGNPNQMEGCVVSIVYCLNSAPLNCRAPRARA